MKKSDRKNGRGVVERSLDPCFIKNLVSHGLTGEEMKRILKEIRVIWWRNDENCVRKDIR